ncbi:MAG: hypothetical protein ACRERS_01060, partial [Methylococcales bacterium]
MVIRIQAQFFFGLLLVEIPVVAITDPFPDIAVHIVNAERIGLSCFDRVGIGFTIAAILGIIRESLLIIAERPGGQTATARRVF